MSTIDTRTDWILYALVQLAAATLWGYVLVVPLWHDFPVVSVAFAAAIARRVWVELM